jgi:cystathionine beta-lyase
MTVQAAPFDDLDLSELYARRSAKWSVFPPDVLPAWVAEMDFPVAEPIRAALQAAIERSDLGYARAGNLGAAFAAFAAEQFGWSLEPRDVVLIPDGIVGIAETLGVLTPRGARVVVNSPVYPPFFDTIAAVGRIVEDVPLLRGAGGWTIDLAALERAFAGGARAYLLCSPHNPLGRVFERDTLAGVAALSARYGVPVIADEIHAPLVLPGAVHTAFPVVASEAGADSVVITSASKTWNLAGLKCAVLVAGSARMRERLDAIPEEVRYRAGHLGVIAALAAFAAGEPWRRDALAQIDRNRHLLKHVLHERIPQIAYTPPQASYLAWLDCSALGLDDPTATFLKRGRVALTSGRPFRGVGPSFVRLNMGTSAAILTEIVDRMRCALD